MAALNGPVQRRLKLHNDWRYDIPLTYQWGVFFYPRSQGTLNQIGVNIDRVIKKYEAVAADRWPVNVNCLDEITDPMGNFGVLLAQSVAMPTDSFDISNTTIDGAGGFLAGPYAGNRQSYGGANKVDITFLKTNIDVIDYFFRPWIIASSYKGLIEDGNSEEDLKCGMQIVQYSRDYNTYQDVIGDGVVGPKIRKVYQFYDVVPCSVAGDEFSYGDMSVSELMKTVSFAFTRYDTLDKFNIPISNGKL